MTLILCGYEIKELGSGYFEVTSPAGRVYTVNLNQPECDCADFIYRGEERPCKHINLIRQLIESGELQPAA